MERKIVILDGYAANPGDLSWDSLKKFGTLEVYDRTSPEQILERAKGAFAIFTNKVVITAQIIESLPELKFIGVLATGYNNVDIAAAKAHGIPVCNVPNYSSQSVVQTVFGHLLNITTQIERHAQSVAAGDWVKSPDFSYSLSPMRQIAGLTIGIYGLGNIGKEVAKIAHAFGMKVIALTSKEQSQLPEYITKVEKTEFFSQSDVLSLNAPLCADNHNFICCETLDLMKPTAIIINTARGGLVDEAALADALNNRKIAAAAVDVLSCEPPKEDNPLLSAQNCYITPHIAWTSDVARKSLLRISAENLEAFIAGHPINMVNK